MSRLIITGASMVSPVGKGMQEAWSALERGVRGIGRLSRFPFGEDILCGEVRDFDLADYVPGGGFRRAAMISQFALASVTRALGEASSPMGEDYTALIMGMTHGALCYTQSFHRELIEWGPEEVSPIYFSDSVLNAPAGNVSICFGIKGPVHTVLGGPEAAIKSVMTACRMLEKGEVGRAAVVSAEELNELSLSCYGRLGFPPISEGAGSIVIESDEAAQSKSPYCFISGMASECNPSDPDAAVSDAQTKCLDMAGLRVSDIDLVMTCERDQVHLILKDVPTATLTPFTGYAFAASALWTIALSAMAIRVGSIPQTIIKSGVPPVHVNNVLACTADRRGSAAAILLSRYVR